MLRIQPEIAVGPGAISVIDVIPLIPRLRFSSHREEQLKAKSDEEET
jgi:hypothetical protein